MRSKGIRKIAGGRPVAGTARRRFLWLAAVIALVALLGGRGQALAGPAGQTQPAPVGQWSDPELIYETGEDIDQPYVFADVFGGTHVLWRETAREVSDDPLALEAIYYVANRDGQWGTGTDVIAMSSAINPTGLVDANGILHVIWSGPNRTLYYSSVPVAAASSALSWSPPQVIDASNLHTHMVADDDGVLHITYAGIGAKGIYYTRYDPAQDSWSVPTNITPAASLRASADYVRLAIGPDNTLHVVWSEFKLPDGWPPTGVYYAQSGDGGATWSEPVQIAGEGYDQINVAVDDAGRIHTAWNGMVGLGGRYHSRSDDGGRSWSAPVAVVPAGKGGTEGLPQLQVDNLGVVHMLTTFNGCAWHASWSGGGWSAPLCISGPRAMASAYIEQPALALANGNQLHAVFWDDRARLWHATRTTGAPPTGEIVPLPEIAAAGDEVTAVIALAPTVAVTATPPDWAAQPAAAPAGTPGGPLLMAAASVVIIAGLVVVVRMFRSR